MRRCACLRDGSLVCDNLLQHMYGLAVLQRSLHRGLVPRWEVWHLQGRTDWTQVGHCGLTLAHHIASPALLCIAPGLPLLSEPRRWAVSLVWCFAFSRPRATRPRNYGLNTLKLWAQAFLLLNWLSQVFSHSDGRLWMFRFRVQVIVLLCCYLLLWLSLFW